MLNEMWYIIHNFYAGTIGWFLMGIVFACICRYLWRHRKDIFLNNNKGD